MSKIDRVILMVLDSLGIGALPDAAKYGDEGACTLGSIAKANPDLHIPQLLRMGLGNIDGVDYLKGVAVPEGAYGRMAEVSKGKDTTTGHWEIAGLYTEVPFKTFPEFPADFMAEFEKRIGRGTLGNYAASGTEIIKALGAEHKATGKPIIYTSADSVFQVAANTAVIPLDELYRICEIARELLTGDLQVGRVIARPFVENPDGTYTRTADRHDYAVQPPRDTVLDKLQQAGKLVYSVGKIKDIFEGKGITEFVKTKSNRDGITQTILAMQDDRPGLIFTNLVEFDSEYGHRRDAAGYGSCLEDFDFRLPGILQALKETDLLIICADHGNDPAYKGWDHTREYVPLLVYGKQVRAGLNLGTRTSFADIAATIAELLGAEAPEIGTSFAKEVLR